MVSTSRGAYFKACQKGNPKAKAVSLDRENDRWQKEKTGALISP
jgi:hypothetical protein